MGAKPRQPCPQCGFRYPKLDAATAMFLHRRGLTNQEIADRYYLNKHTVGALLSRARADERESRWLA